MTRKSITLTPSEAASIKDLVGRIRAICPDNLRIFNLCRRIGALLARSERRRYRVTHKTNSLLMQEDIINEIFN